MSHITHSDIQHKFFQGPTRIRHVLKNQLRSYQCLPILQIPSFRKTWHKQHVTLIVTSFHWQYKYDDYRNVLTGSFNDAVTTTQPASMKNHKTRPPSCKLNGALETRSSGDMHGNDVRLWSCTSTSMAENGGFLYTSSTAGQSVQAASHDE
jgi:hypothetical protein